MKSLDFGRYALGDFAAAAPFGRVRRIAAADQRTGRLRIVYPGGKLVGSGPRAYGITVSRNKAGNDHQ